MQDSWAAPGELMAGQSLAHYRIIGKIGAGGMGVVYKAEDTRLKRIVALKLLVSGGGISEEHRERFKREAQAIAALDHPNICTVYEILETPEYSAIALSWVEGVNLAARIKTGTLTANAALDIAIQVAQGLEAAHRKGVVHRDVKPANVLLDSDGQAKLVDFGLARMTEDVQITREGIALGTPAYMAPEQWTSTAVDHRADLWSVGVMLYEMVTGKHPFRRADPRALGHAILHEPYAPIQPPDGFPPRMAEIIGKLLQKRPEDRYASAAELLSDLRALRTATASHPSLTPAHLTSTVSMPQLRPAAAPPAPAPGAMGRRRLALLGVLGFCAAAGMLYYLRRGSSAGPGVSERPSIAVLPLDNLSKDPDDDYFSDGLADELISALSKVPEVRVVARTSAFQFRGKNLDVREVSNRLRVSSLLTGSVRRSGDQLRISMQLVNAADGYLLWSEVYERQAGDVFVIQKQITDSVLRALKVKLREREGPPAQQTRNLEAYNLYLRGIYQWNKRSEAGFNAALESFRKALALDPGYALAWTGLADTQVLRAQYGQARPREAMPEAKAAARKALDLNPAIAEAHTSLGLILILHDWDRAGAEAEFRKAIELNPGYANAHHWYAHFLAWNGRFAEAMHELDQAQELDPLSLAIQTNIGWILGYSRRFEEAIQKLRGVVELDPNFVRAHLYLSTLYSQRSRFPEALAEAGKARALAGDAPVILSLLGWTHGLAGRKAEALREATVLLEMSQRTYVSPHEIAMVFIGAGELDEAMKWLEKAYQDRSPTLIFLGVDFRHDPLRSDPRFIELMKKIDSGAGERSQADRDGIQLAFGPRLAEPAQLYRDIEEASRREAGGGRP